MTQPDQEYECLAITGGALSAFSWGDPIVRVDGGYQVLGQRGGPRFTRAELERAAEDQDITFLPHPLTVQSSWLVISTTITAIRPALRHVTAEERQFIAGPEDALLDYQRRSWDACQEVCDELCSVYHHQVRDLSTRALIMAKNMLFAAADERQRLSAIVRLAWLRKRRGEDGLLRSLYELRFATYTASYELFLFLIQQHEDYLRLLNPDAYRSAQNTVAPPPRAALLA